MVNSSVMDIFNELLLGKTLQVETLTAEDSKVLYQALYRQRERYNASVDPALQLKMRISVSKPVDGLSTVCLKPLFESKWKVVK